jgi:hypothetical protein
VRAKISNQLILVWEWAKDFFWRRQSIYAFLLILLLGGVVVQLSAIPNGFAETEKIYASSVANISDIGENPLYLPHKLASYVVSNFSDSIRAIRAVSIVFLGFSIVALYRILKRWHSDKVALFATSMFALNATTLAVGRLGAPLVLILTWSIVISILMWLQHGNSRKVAPVSLLVVSTALLYIPGAPYFFLLLAILFGKKLLATIKGLSNKTIILTLASSLFVFSPLILSFVNNTNLIKEWLLLPQTIEWSSILTNILKVPSAYIYRTPVDPLLNVGTLPVLDVAAGGLFLIGLYAYQRNAKLERTKIMLLTAIFGIILGALGQVTIGIILLLPFVYSVVAAGISYILDEWYSVFPKNPFARSFGLLLVTLVVILSVYYQATRFFVVWPQTPETRSTYNQSGLIQ